MREVTILVPEERIPEFYERFGAFMSEAADSVAPMVATVGSKPVPAWATGPGAVELVAKYWSALSADGQTVLGILIDGALREPPEKFTPQQLVVETGHPNGVSGIAGIFGAAGRAAKKVGIPRYRYSDTNAQTWHFIWDWDGSRYWMIPEVAKLFREAMLR